MIKGYVSQEFCDASNAGVTSTVGNKGVSPHFCVPPFSVSRCGKGRGMKRRDYFSGWREAGKRQPQSKYYSRHVPRRVQLIACLIFLKTAPGSRSGSRRDEIPGRWMGTGGV